MRFHLFCGVLVIAYHIVFRVSIFTSNNFRFHFLLFRWRKWLLFFFSKIIRVYVWTCDIARPLSCKTKTTYFFKTNTKTGQTKTKTAFLKTIKLLIQDHWRSQKF